MSNCSGADCSCLNKEPPNRWAKIDVKPNEHFEKGAVGKNIHSVLTYCPECKTWGCNMPLNKVCGDCRYPNGIVYYDAETVQILLDRK